MEGCPTDHKGPATAGVNVTGAVEEGVDGGMVAVPKTAAIDRAGGRAPSRGANPKED